MTSQSVSVNDTDFERGRERTNDSSSSRDSSPVIKRKRGLTPVSDDDEAEEVVLPATAIVDETPPPPERPLVREPVAFSSVAANVTTYQASLIPSSSSQIKYLPGQDPSTTKAKKRRTKRVTPFSAQTGRFRLQAYDHGSSTRNCVEPLQQGQGPYHSLYRASNNGTPTPVDQGVISGSNTPQSHSSSSRPPSKRPRHSTQQEDLDIFAASLLTMPDPMLYSSEPVHSYYSSDFQLQDTGEFPSGIMTQPLQATQVVQSSTSPPTHNISNVDTVQRTGTGHSRNMERANDAGTDSPGKRPGFHNRMITILIHDMRSGKMDRQLAEVTIPVKMADDPQDGFWADAKDISEQLQSSPSRVDGPARVYTLRGKYRQIFLRVSAENVDNIMSSNIGISADRTLDVVVESPPEVGNRPPSPRIPNELLPSSPEVIDTSELSDESFARRKNNQKGKKAQTRRKQGGQKRQHSSSDDSGSDHGPGARGKHSRPQRASQKKSKGSKSKGTVAMSALDHLPALKDRRNSMGVRTFFRDSFEKTRGYESPSTDEDPSRLYNLIVRAVEIIIQKQPDGSSYYKWRVGTVSELIHACGFIQRMMDELVGEMAPFRTKTHEIRKSHVIAALRIEPKMATESTEILQLLGLYGENGIRGYDSRVSEMIARRDPKPYKQLKQLLRLLRNIHEEWKRKHGGQSDTLGE
ncbi:hypothetical protein AX14_005158 [Amanita brunnescens Koide BX004]|nr:hypothetical protein AX14_011609 [Amanita brunnescens Koide BX004]KAF8731094.1 hypothetical protein AX14_005158 [Amanita brunnescens Koide BX004]